MAMGSALLGLMLLKCVWNHATQEHDAEQYWWQEEYWWEDPTGHWHFRCPVCCRDVDTGVWVLHDGPGDGHWWEWLGWD